LEREKEVDFSYLHENLGRFRANVFYQRGQPCIAMRHVKANIPSLADLHLPEKLAEIATAERGIILVTGATGSGKSSSMAAMLEHVNTHEKCHVVTLEDPIEYMFEDKQSVIE